MPRLTGSNGEARRLDLAMEPRTVRRQLSLPVALDLFERRRALMQQWARLYRITCLNVSLFCSRELEASTYPARATMVPREMDQTPDSARSNLFSREITGQRDNLLHAVNQRRDFSRAGDIPPWTVKDVVSVVAQKLDLGALQRNDITPTCFS